MKWTRYVFFIFWAVTLLSFIPSLGAGFVFDFPGWQKEYENGSFADIINCFSYNGNHQFLHFIFYSFYKIFYLHSLPWYLLFCTLYAANGNLLYQLMLQLARRWKFNISPVIAVLGTCIFLLNPYCVEVVVWKVCVHYLLSLIAILWILILFIKFVQTENRKHLLAGGIIYFLSLFTLEISFVTPLIVIFLSLIFLLTGERKVIVRTGIKYAGTLLSLLLIHLLINKLTLGNIVGHYGGDVHMKYDLFSLASTEIKYFIKHLFYARFYSFKTKGILFDQFSSLPETAFFGICLLIVLAIFYFTRIKKIKPQWHLAFFGFVASLLFIVPVANIYFLHLHIGMNDRYSFIPLAFFTMSIVAVLTMVPRWLAYSVLGTMLILNIFFQQKTLKYWHQSTQVLSSLKENYRWHDAPYVFILNSPDNFKGIVMTCIINEASGIDELIDYQTPQPNNGKVYDIFQFNMTTPHDGVKVEQTGPMQLKVTFNQWGNWWHRNGIGASSYENEFYKAETLDYPYLITFKQFPEGSVIIYQDGKEWKEFTFLAKSF